MYEIQIYTATELHLGCEIAYANGDHAHIWHSYIQPLQGTLLIRTRYNLHSSIIWNNAFPKVTEHETYENYFSRQLCLCGIHGFNKNTICFGQSNNPFNMNSFTRNLSVANHSLTVHSVLFLEKVWMLM